MTTITVEALMGESGVKFGTSGARGLVTDMTDRVCYAYTAGFIQYLEELGTLAAGSIVAVSGDLRPSTERIMAAAGKAIVDRGYTVTHCGRLPSPALALYGLVNAIPTVMVTGSHIPDDRNGIKYTTAAGEILKHDEAGMKRQELTLNDELFDDHGMLVDAYSLPPEDITAGDAYVKRYLDFFGTGCLDGASVGIFQHSAVGRDLLPRIYQGLGAHVTLLGRSDSFIPVDTEAIRPEDVTAAAAWAEEHGFDAIISTDGDSDRPLISDERGRWLRGDVLGILCAGWLGAQAVVTPVSCNSAVEKSGLFGQVQRTRIGSPFVIEAMQQAEAAGQTPVVGYEANGGFLLQSPVTREARTLAPLPTRDAVLPQLCVLVGAVEQDCAISALVGDLPQRFTYSDRLKQFPLEISHARVAALDEQAATALLGEQLGPIAGMDDTDGVRITFANDDVVHIRPSGNAPELRCYTEAGTEARARELAAIGIAALKTWR